MHSHNDLHNSIKMIAQGVSEAGSPAKTLYGNVVSDSPLTINVDQRMTLTEEFLVVPESLTDHEVDIMLEWESFDSVVKQKTTITVLNGLKAGDKVVLSQQKGGQKFIVQDRVVG